MASLLSLIYDLNGGFWLLRYYEDVKETFKTNDLLPSGYPTLKYAKLKIHFPLA